MAAMMLLVAGACDAREPSQEPRSERSWPASTDRGGDAGAPRTIHVSSEGDDDDDGSAARPFETLERGFETLRPGDTLLVADGRYEERLRDLDIRPGREDAPITVRAADGARPVVEGLLWLSGADHWRISGINVTWSDDNRRDEHMVKFTDGEGWQFTDAEVWGARSYAAILVVGEPSDFLLARLYVHDTKKANGRNEDHLIYLNSGSGGGVVERNVLVGSPNGRAVKIGPGEWDGPRVENVVVRFNTMYDNLGPSNVQLTWKASRNEIYRNILVNSAEDRANVTVFELDGDDNRVYENVGWGGSSVVERSRGIEASANLEEDPDFTDAADGDFMPRNERAKAYGRYAP